jgi:hypothetical protein
LEIGDWEEDVRLLDAFPFPISHLQSVIKPYGQRTWQDLPCSLQQISKEIAFLAGIRAAEEQANRGDLIDHERIREELQTWISSN